MTLLPKPSRTERVKAKKATRAAQVKHEKDEKAKVRRLDKTCRFPLCGCRALGLRLEVSHQEHKGMGGNPSGDRSTADQMILLCVHRHQDGLISRHKGTLRVVALDEQKGMRGPVGFDVDVSALPEALRPADLPPGHLEPTWRRLATENRQGGASTGTAWQAYVLLELRKMDL